MATQVNIYVDPDAGGANDGSSWTDAYTSLATAVSSKERDLVSADEYQIFHCRANSLTDDDNGAVVVDGSTTDATRYRQIQCDSADRSNSWDRAGSKQYRVLYNAHWEELDLDDDDVRVLGIQIDHSSFAGECLDPGHVVGTLTAAYNWLRVGNYDNLGSKGFASWGSGCSSKIYNNIVFNVKYGIGMDLGNSISISNYVFNNTVILPSTAGINAEGIGNTSTMWLTELYVRNNLVQDASGNGKCFDLSGNSGSWGAGRYDYNLSEDATADNEVVANNIINTAVTFVNEGSDDYHLNSSEDGNYQGNDESSIFSDDIDEETRTDWDIGADEIIAVGDTFVRTMTDSVGIGDVRVDVKTFSRTLSENLGVADVPDRSATYPRILAATLGLVDDLIKGETKVIADSLNLSDTFGRSLGYVRSEAEALGISDSIIPLSVFLRAFTETMDIIDTTSKITSFSRILAEALGLEDSMVRSQIQVRVIVDDIGLLDLMQKGEIASFAENMGVTDSMSRLVSYISNPSDDIGIADDMISVAVALRTISDNIGLLDTQTVEHISDLVKAVWAFMLMKKH